ncbi:MAG: hypothetical protein MJ174_06815 [Treponema sp.]|nr:hypothetical protein [Treponema sp.]
MFEAKYLTNSDDLKKFQILKNKFYTIKSVVEKSLKESTKVNPYTGESLSSSQIAELNRKAKIIAQIEPLLVPEYNKFQDFCFYFNNGQFRTEDEIESYKKIKIHQDWSVCDEFNKNVPLLLLMVCAVAALFLILPFLLAGRSAIILYIFPVWPLISIVGAILLYRFAKTKLFQNNTKNNHFDNKEMKKYYRYGTTVSFMQKFF